jgi:hypothetical protein
MDRRQIAMSICATSAASGVGTLLASLEPWLSKYQTLLEALGSAGLFGAMVGFLVLLITASPTSGAASVGQSAPRPPFLNDEQKNFVLVVLSVGALLTFSVFAAVLTKLNG